MSPKRMNVERWARRVVEEELEQIVQLHDDQSEPSMYDLRVGPAHAPAIAIECVGAVDQDRVETWNIGPAKGALHLGLLGDWTVSLARKARVKLVRNRLGPLLRLCEIGGTIRNLRVDWVLKDHHPDLHAEFQKLGIVWAHCYRLPGTGKVHLNMEGVGGPVDETGISIGPWLSDFLASVDRADVLSKLASSRAAERHAFVIVDFGGVPFSVQSYLEGSLDVLPPSAPTLPSPVTAVWLVSTSNDRGIRWTGAIWKRFRAVSFEEGGSAA